MPRELALTCVALAVVAGAFGCGPRDDYRARLASGRTQKEAIVRETEMVQRVTTPSGPTRIIYTSPPDLSEQNLLRTHAPIVGIERVPQPSEPARHSGPPSR